MILAISRIYWQPMTSATEIDTADAPEPSLFSALLTPYRALDHTGFIILMTLIGGVSFLVGIAFLRMGAWPVFGFLGLDVLAIYLAFKVNFSRANATEEITVTRSELRVRRVDHRGKVSEFVLNPLWVKLDKESDEEFGIERLFLISRGRRFTIAHFLAPEEKASFAKALMAALHDAKVGPTLNPLT